MSLPFDKNKLRYFVPLSELTSDNFDELVKSIKIETMPANKVLFNRGDMDDYTYYLLNGEIEYTDGDGNKTLLSAKSRQCRFPLEHNRPRQKSALAKTDLHFFRIDNNYLDILLTWDQNKNYVVSEINSGEQTDETDWMTQILQSEIFHKIPPANIQAMFQRIQAVPVLKDEVIMKQGDPGDYYYMIQNGNCRVLRNAEETGNKELKIADINAGSGFGEEALISNTPRNATIIMNTDGTLMRLSKEDFTSLLKEPALKSVDYEQAQEMVKSGAQWLDVRLLSEHQNKKIPGSINIPLFLLRLNADKLSRSRKYIVYCDTGSRSASATYILNERGYDASILEGGLMNSTVTSEENAA